MNASFTTFAGLLLNWLADYYLAASIVLVVAFLAWRWMRQPVHRLAVAWAVMIELVVLAVACAMPFWPKISLVTAETPKPAVELPPVVKQEIAPRPLASMERVLEERPLEMASAKREIAKPVEKRLPPKVRWNWKEWISAAYLAGAALVSLWLCWGAAAAALMRRRARPASESLHSQLAEVVQNRDAASRRIQGESGKMPLLLLVSEHVASAVALGVLRPAIILPAALAENAPPQTVYAVLKHEWCHIHNRDLWLLALGRCLLVAFFVHPLFWWLRRAVRGDQELLADAVAAGDQRQDYAEELLRLVRNSAHSSPPAVSAAVGLWEGPSQLTRRITMLLDETFCIHPTGSRRAKIGALGLMLLLGAACSLLTLQPARSEEELKKPATATNSTPEQRTELAEKKPDKEGKSKDKKGIATVSGGTLVITGSSSYTVTDEDTKDIFVLPGYELILRPKMITELKITPEQKKELQEISAKFYADQQKYSMEHAQKKPSPADQASARKRFYEQRNALRKQIEAVLTAEQFQAINDVDLSQKAYYRMGSVATIESLGIKDLSQDQKDKIPALQKQMYLGFENLPQEAKKKIMAIFNPDEQAKIREFVLGSDGSAIWAQTIVPLEGTNEQLLIPTLDPHPDFSLDFVQQKLDLTEDQKKRVREILGGSESLTDRLVKEVKKSAAEDRKDTATFLTAANTATGTATISGSGKILSPEDKRKQEEQFFENVKKERKKQRAEWVKQPLVKLSIELREQFEAALAPEQRAKYREMAFDRVYYSQLDDPLLLREIRATAEQQSAVRRIVREAQEENEAFTREMGKKLMNVLTPPQREKLREAIEREEEAIRTGNYVSPGEQGKTERKADSIDEKPAKKEAERGNLPQSGGPESKTEKQGDVSNGFRGFGTRISKRSEPSAQPIIELAEENEGPVTVISDSVEIANRLTEIRDVARWQDGLFKNLRIKGSFNPNNEAFALTIRNGQCRYDLEVVVPDGRRLKSYWLDDGKNSYSFSQNLLVLDPTYGSPKRWAGMHAGRLFMHFLLEYEGELLSVSELCDRLIGLLHDGKTFGKNSPWALRLYITAHQVEIEIRLDEKKDRIFYRRRFALDSDKRYVLTRFRYRDQTLSPKDELLTLHEVDCRSEYQEYRPGIYFLSKNDSWRKSSGMKLEELGEASEGRGSARVDSVEIGDFSIEPGYFDVRSWPPIKPGIDVDDNRVKPHRMFRYEGGSFEEEVLDTKWEGKASSSNNVAKNVPASTPLMNDNASKQLLEAFQRDYALPDGVDVKRIAPPFPAGRMEYYRVYDAEQAKILPEGPDYYWFRWGEGKPDRFRIGMITSGGMGWVGGKGVEIASLIHSFAGIHHFEMLGDEKLIRTKVSGDWVIRDGATPEKLLYGLQAILQKECKVPVRFRLTEQDRRVIVAEGEYDFHPLPGNAYNDEAGVPWEQIDIYEKDRGRLAETGNGSSLNDVFNLTGMFLNRPVVNEVSKPPTNDVIGRWSARRYQEARDRKAVDEAAVLKHLSEQTGLTFTEKTRRVRVLLVERDE